MNNLPSESNPSHFRRVRRNIVIATACLVVALLAIAGVQFKHDLDAAHRSQLWLYWREGHCTPTETAGAHRLKGSVYEPPSTYGRPGTWRCGSVSYTLDNSDIPPNGWILPPGEGPND